jgi:hypothetical protein
MLIQQDHDIGETETDVLKQKGVVVDRVRTVCAKYTELTSPAASKGDTTRSAEPAPHQQQLRLVHAAEKLKTGIEVQPLRVHEIAAVHKVVTEAISGNTGASVYMQGPFGSGKRTALSKVSPAVREWCEEHAKLMPIYLSFLVYTRHRALCWPVRCDTADAQR